MSLLDKISGALGKQSDNFYNKGWMTYIIIGIIVAIIIVLWKA
jgi:hypothetical protein